MHTNDPPAEVLIGIAAVMAITSLSKATIYRQMKIGRFPEAKVLVPGNRRVAWLKSEVLAWAAAPFDWGDPITW